ncbi:MAG TPA: PmoA family protein [Candidatus Hydrogenedentes bacterium]|nr:PmoA family protein [Candidatus Hydrogenedentota bacterium]
MRKWAVTWYGVAHGIIVGDTAPSPETSKELSVAGEIWASTVTPAYDPQKHYDTCKVYSHLFGPQTQTPITKGSGGFDAHQRGLHIGWRRTEVGDQILDSWHMVDCSQRCVPNAGNADGVYLIEWCDRHEKPFMREVRILTCRPGHSGLRMLDLETRLTAIDRPVRLRGDSHHAGVQIRLANEVCRHPWSTQFVLPKTARILRDDTVADAPWVCCQAMLSGQSIRVLHMTNPANPRLEGFVYGMRQYGLFGASFHTDLMPGLTLPLRFRIAWTNSELTFHDCETLYHEYTAV